MADSLDEDMPEQSVPLRMDLTCPVCRDLFRDPVLLPCTHSFCRECMQSCYKANRKCPVCRGPCEEAQAITNRALSDACDTFREEASRWTPRAADTCPLHQRPLDRYCEKDEEPVCRGCVALHSTHRLCTLQDGVQKCQKELGFKVEIFQKKVDAYKKTTHKLSNAIEYIKYQAGQAERQIRLEFERLRAELVAEEARRMEALAAEEVEKIAALQELLHSTDDDIAAITKLKEMLQKEMGNEDLPLLQNFQKLKRETEWTREEPRLPDHSLLNMGKHVGALSFKIWKNMQNHVKCNPVVFNPNTASPWLSIHPDLSGVMESAERLVVPDNPERFDPCVFVLGAEGYFSGKHRWDVVVGDNPKWVVGVCKQSVPRKRKFTVSTSRGVWAIGLSKGVYTVSTPERTELQVQQRPERIRVKLDLEKGEVSFWDGGTSKHLATLTHKFDEKVFPIFGPGLYSTATTLAPAKIAVHTS